MPTRATSAQMALVALLTAVPAVASSQPSFALEVEGGRNAGLTPYLRNVVYTDDDIRGREGESSPTFRPYLADERSGWGTALAVRLVSDRLQGGLSMQWFDISTARVHHRGRVPGQEDDRLRSTRIRTDGTVDDSGVEYEELDPPTDVPAGAGRSTNLFVFGIEGGYRFPLYSGDFDIYAPANGMFVVSYLGRKFAPLRPGLGVKTGVSTAFDFVSVMSVIVGGRVQWFATPTYWNRSDAARRAAELGEATESALFSSQLSASFRVGLRFTIR
jgi:hypothetical protein